MKPSGTSGGLNGMTSSEIGALSSKELALAVKERVVVVEMESGVLVRRGNVSLLVVGRREKQEEEEEDRKEREEKELRAEECAEAIELKKRGRRCLTLKGSIVERLLMT